MYKSIKTLPLTIFEEIGKTGNLTLLGKGTAEETLEAWNSINREFFEEFGVKDKQIEQIRSKIRYLKHMTKYYLDGDKFSRTLANLELSKEEIGKSKSKGVSYLKICVNLSKILEFRLDYNSLSTAEFFHYMELAEEISKQYK